MYQIFATTQTANTLFAVASVGILIGSWFFGRALTVVTKGKNPLIWRGKRER